jgi:predicted TIM-barrel fold metal-dependent hydrolase
MDPRFAAAACRAYNDWLHDYIAAADPKRLFGAAAISPHEIDSAVAETRRAVAELGMKAIFLRPNIYNERPWHDRYYDPLWAACQELNVPVGFHETTGSRMKASGADRFQSLGIAHISTHSMEQMLASMDVIMGGVMERFPKLRFAFLEAQCGWLPFWLGRMDEHYEWREPYGEMTHLSAKPSEYFRRQGFCAVECDEEFVAHVVAAFGDDNLVTTTDYPHGDSKYPRAMDRFLALPLSDHSKQKILWDNALRLYAL